MVCNGQDLNRIVGFAEKNRERKTSQRYTADIRVLLYRILSWRLTNQLQDCFEFSKIRRT
ncbi:MAG: hypothetical protein CL700_12090 [Chloroflexi bacterium]|nr:hypothetical protein [Chloroflexota bacterium]